MKGLVPAAAQPPHPSRPATDDVRYEAFNVAGAGKWMRATHIPSGCCVELRNGTRKSAFAALQQYLAEEVER